MEGGRENWSGVSLFGLDRAASNDAFRRVQVVTKNEGFRRTVGARLGGLLLIGGAAAVVGRVMVRRLSTGLR